MVARIKDDDRKAFEKLAKRFPLRPIRTVKDNDRAAEICDELTDRLDSLSQAELDYLEVLTDLIEKFESQWSEELSGMTPRELITYLMHENNLSQSDLVSEFGSASRVSEFLSGKRALSLEQARRLSARFSLKLTALIQS